MKILHVIATLAPRDGGPSKACFEMARAVARRGHDVAIFATDMDGTGRLDVPLDRPVVQDRVALRYFRAAAPRLWARSPTMAKALAATIPGVDVVHMHSLYLHHDFVVGQLCRRHGVPYILRPHGSLDPYLWRRHRWRKLAIELAYQNRVTRSAARIHYTTEDERRLAEPHAFGVPGFVVPNGLEPDEFARLPPAGQFRARHPEIGDRPLALFLGRLNFKKGLDILCDAFAQVSRDMPDARLVIAGPDDGMAEPVRRWLAAHGIVDRVLFTGMLTGNDKQAVLRDADLFVLPSYTENFGIAVIEALACGIPVAISDRVGVWREIEAASAGWVTPVAVAPFAAAMRDALSDRPAARIRGANGLDLVTRAFSWPAIAGELERVYADILGGTASGDLRLAGMRA